MRNETTAVRSMIDSAPGLAVPALPTGLRRAGAGLLDRIERQLEAERDQLGLWVPVALAGGIALWLMLPAPAPVPGGYDYARTAWFLGIGATGKALDRPTIEPGAAEGGFATWLADRRAGLSAHIEASVTGASAGGIAASFATGDQGA